MCFRVGWVVFWFRFPFIGVEFMFVEVIGCCFRWVVLFGFIFRRWFEWVIIVIVGTVFYRNWWLLWGYRFTFSSCSLVSVSTKPSVFLSITSINIYSLIVKSLPSSPLIDTLFTLYFLIIAFYLFSLHSFLSITLINLSISSLPISNPLIYLWYWGIRRVLSE